MPPVSSSSADHHSSTFHYYHNPHHYGSFHDTDHATNSISSGSNEADDERSPSPFSAYRANLDMVSSSNLGKAQYPGEDIRPTSTKELRGWYIYAWAAEVFAVCGVGSFIPITLEQLARERGVLLSDHATPCTAKPDGQKLPRRHDDDSAGQCVVNVLGTEINTASFALYTFSLSVLLQVFVVISMSGAADHGRYRKSFLLTFALIGSIATMSFLPVTPNVYLLGALFAIVGNTCFGTSFVLLNSYLPVLVRYHPDLEKERDCSLPADEELRNTNGTQDGEASPLLADDEPHDLDHNFTSQSKKEPSPPSELRLSTKLSSNGIGIGYIAAVTLQILGVAIVLISSGSLLSLRIVLFLIGLWWFTFTIPAALWLRPRPGPPLHLPNSSTSRIWLAYLTHAWQSLGKTTTRARRLKDLLLFLSAWFLLSDAMATISGTAVLYAKTTLLMSPAALALINVCVMVSGVAGALLWPKVSRRLSLPPIRTLMATLLVFLLIPLYALLSYIPFIRTWGVLGLQQPWETYPMGSLYGLVLGGLNSYCRALFSELVPPGYEAAFFALYAITDKGSSVLGPAVVGALVDATGSVRPAFGFLAVLVAVPILVLLGVDMERGKEKGRELGKELDELEGGGSDP